MHPLSRSLALVLALVACAGPEEPTDSDLPEGCELSTGFTVFDATAAAGGELRIPVTTEARCPDPLTLELSWRDPHTGVFVLSDTLQASPTVVLQPYEPQDLVVFFRPTETGSYDDRLILQSDSAIVGGVILRFRGVAE